MKLRHRQALEHLLKNPARISHPIVIEDDLLDPCAEKSADFFDTFHQHYFVIEKTLKKNINCQINQAPRKTKRSSSVRGSSKNQKTAASRTSLLTDRTTNTKSSSPPKLTRHQSLKHKPPKVNTSRPKTIKSKKKLKTQNKK